jgi:16S rRNA (guanine966-N2)-methyltransferase
MAANEVRIIGGKWKGRKLRFSEAPGLRPTLGRVRETLFNWLNLRIAGSRCLDLFAGSGALGFEALSRGAAEVTLVDENRRTAQMLRETAASLNAGSDCTIECASAARFLREPRPCWDIIFLDPPFDEALLPDVLRRIRAERSLCQGGVVYFEMQRRAAVDFPGFALRKERTAGDTRFGLLELQDATASAEPDSAPCAPRSARSRPEPPG